MSISAIGSPLGPQVTGIGSADARSSVSTANAVPAGPPPQRAGVSKMGELMGKLSELADSNPEEYKAVTGDIANQLRELAQSATGKEQAMLKDLASRFEGASESGSLPTRPAGPPPGPPPGQQRTGYEQGQPAGPSSELRSQIDSVIANALSSI